jgi:hypothetical protein
MRAQSECGRRLLRAAAILPLLYFSVGVSRADEPTAPDFCDWVKGRADTIKSEWGMSDLTLFGCLLPTSTKVSDSPLTYTASGTVWFTGTTNKGEDMKGKREVRGVMTQAKGGEFNVDRLEYGNIEDLGFFSQFFTWLLWVVLLSLALGLAVALAGLFLPKGLVSVVGSLLMIGLVWYLGDTWFGSTLAAVLCTLGYLIVAGGLAKAAAEA